MSVSRSPVRLSRPIPDDRAAERLRRARSEADTPRMAEERPATARKSRKMWRWVVGLVAALWVGHCANQNFLFFQARAHAGALLGSLEDYHTRYGHYPEDLHEMPSFLELDDSYRERITYTSYERGSNFFLSAIHPFSKEMETYKSEDGRWRAHHLRQLRTILEDVTSEH